MPIKHRISNTIIHDVDIRPFTDAQLFKLINQWNSEKINLQRVEIHAYGYSGEDSDELKSNEPVKTQMTVFCIKHEWYVSIDAPQSGGSDSVSGFLSLYIIVI